VLTVAWAGQLVGTTAEAAGPDSDSALLTFQLTIAPQAGPISFPSSGATFSILGSCAQVAPAPSFVDVPPDEGTSCGQFSGGGSFTEAGCAVSEGVGTGSATLIEPSGDTVTIAGMTLALSGTAVVLEANQASGGWQEPGSAPGDVVGLGVAVPLGATCLGGPTQYAVTMVMTAAYVGS
jgi:hypothetical protein